MVHLSQKYFSYKFSMTLLQKLSTSSNQQLLSKENNSAKNIQALEILYFLCVRNSQDFFKWNNLHPHCIPLNQLPTWFYEILTELCVLVAQVVSNSLQLQGSQPAVLICPGKNTGVGCHSLLPGVFPTQGLNPGLLHCRQILYHLSPLGSPTALWCYGKFFIAKNEWQRAEDSGVSRSH